MRIFLVLLLFIATTTYSQKKDRYDVLMNKMQIKEQSEMMILQIIDIYTKQKINVPDTVWQDIKKIELNTNYLIDVKKVFKENYSITEVNNLISIIDKYGVNAYKPNPKITEKLYEVGKAFGKSIGTQIQDKLKLLGY